MRIEKAAGGFVFTLFEIKASGGVKQTNWVELSTIHYVLLVKIN